jgi:hypothetical protein
MQGTAMGNDSFTVLKATSGKESSVGATEICDSRCRKDKFRSVAEMEWVTMRAVGSLCFYIYFLQ